MSRNTEQTTQPMRSMRIKDRYVKDLYDEAEKLREAERVAFQKVLDYGRTWAGAKVEPEDARALEAARRQRNESNDEADRQYHEAAAFAELAIERIEAAAEEAKRAVLARYQIELTDAKTTVSAARKDRTEAYEAARVVENRVLEEIKSRVSKEHDEASAARRKAEVALAVAAIGGPALLPSALHVGSRRFIQVRSGCGYCLTYRLHGTGRGGDKPGARVELTVDKPSDGFTGVVLVDLMTRTFEGENFRDAIRKAEDSGVSEGWLVREVQS